MTRRPYRPGGTQDRLPPSLRSDEPTTCGESAFSIPRTRVQLHRNTQYQASRMLDIRVGAEGGVLKCPGMARGPTLDHANPNELAQPKMNTMCGLNSGRGVT